MKDGRIVSSLDDEGRPAQQSRRRDLRGPARSRSGSARREAASPASLTEEIEASYSTREGLSNDRVWSIVEDRDGSLWIGTDGGGLNRFRDGRFTVYREPEGVPADRPVALPRQRRRSVDRQRRRRPPPPPRRDLPGLRSAGRPPERDGRDAAGGPGRKPLDRHPGRTVAPRGRPHHVVRPRRRALGRHGALDLRGRRGKPLGRDRDRRARPPEGREVHRLHAARKACRATGSARSTRTRRAPSGWAPAARASTASSTASSRRSRRRTDCPATSCGPCSRTAPGTCGSAPGPTGSPSGSEGQFRAFRHKDGLPSDIVRSMYRDRAGTLWVGTDDGGLVAVRGGRFQVYGRREGLSGNTVLAILQDHDGRAVGRNRGRRPQPVRGRPLPRLHDRGRPLRRHRPLALRGRRRLPLDRDRRRRAQPLQGRPLHAASPARRASSTTSSTRSSRTAAATSG